MPKICLVSAGLAGGGMERAVTNLANYAAEQGHQVVILNLFKTEVFFDLNKEIEIVWPDLQRSKMHRLVYAARLIPYIRKSIKSIKPDTILSYGEWFNSYVILATIFLNVPVYLTDRMGPLLNIGFLLENARKLTYCFANGIISQTETAKTILRKKTNAKNITVIPNPARPITNEGSLDPKNWIITVGRLSREKGHNNLIKAFIQANLKDWELHIVGDGNERSNLEKLASDLGGIEKIIFHGHLKYFNHLLFQSKIFVLPSLYEGFPNALVEAMTVPLASISSDCIAGPSDIIQHGENGLLYPPNDIDALTSYLKAVASDSGLRNKLKSNAKEIGIKLDYMTINNRYLNFILNVES